MDSLQTSLDSSLLLVTLIISTSRVSEEVEVSIWISDSYFGNTTLGKKFHQSSLIVTISVSNQSQEILYYYLTVVIHIGSLVVSIVGNFDFVTQFP